jgi:hypothetical protein
MKTFPKEYKTVTAKGICAFISKEKEKKEATLSLVFRFVPPSKLHF